MVHRSLLTYKVSLSFSCSHNDSGRILCESTHNTKGFWGVSLNSRWSLHWFWKIAKMGMSRTGRRAWKFAKSSQSCYHTFAEYPNCCSLICTKQWRSSSHCFFFFFFFNIIHNDYVTLSLHEHDDNECSHYNGERERDYTIDCLSRGWIEWFKCSIPRIQGTSHCTKSYILGRSTHPLLWARWSRLLCPAWTNWRSIWIQIYYRSILNISTLPFLFKCCIFTLQ